MGSGAARATAGEDLYAAGAADSGGGAGLGRTYVYCTQPPGEAFTRIATRLRADPQWRVVDFPTFHNVQYTMARELADLLVGVLRG